MEAITNGCRFWYQQQSGDRIFNLTVVCDPSAYTLQPPSAIVVTGRGSSTFVYSGTFRSAAVCRTSRL